MNSWVAIAVGASLGAWLRWGLSLWLNGGGLLPLGTLLANALGGFLMGGVLAAIQGMPQLSLEWRLFLSTGFLGGLTTFSTFSAEAFSLLQKELYGWAALHIASHVVVSIGLTMVGYWCVCRWHAGA